MGLGEKYGLFTFWGGWYPLIKYQYVHSRRTWRAAAAALLAAVALWGCGQTAEDTGQSTVPLVTDTGQSSSSVSTEPAPPTTVTEPPVTAGEDSPTELTVTESDAPPPATTEAPTEPTHSNVVAGNNGIVCGEYSLFTGQFPEDGRDELVENVAAILVTNTSDRFLDLATITFDIDGQTATFSATGLPSGASAWVMEASRMTATDSSVFTYRDCVTAFRDDVVDTTPKITITADGNMLTATNHTSETLTNVCVYYKTVHTDGNFFGGITYLASFGDLAPGASVETLAGHFDAEDSLIVRIGFAQG